MTAAEPSVVLEPVECDVCGQALRTANDFTVVTIVADRTPRQLRNERGGGFIENEWRLDPVCARCYEKLEAWLFASRTEDADTLPAPPPLPVESTRRREEVPSSAQPVEPAFEERGFEDELAPFAAPAPNRS